MNRLGIGAYVIQCIGYMKTMVLNCYWIDSIYSQVSIQYSGTGAMRWLRRHFTECKLEHMSLIYKWTITLVPSCTTCVVSTDISAVCHIIFFFTDLQAYIYPDHEISTWHWLVNKAHHYWKKNLKVSLNIVRTPELFMPHDRRCQHVDRHRHIGWSPVLLICLYHWIALANNKKDLYKGEQILTNSKDLLFDGRQWSVIIRRPRRRRRRVMRRSCCQLW